jgi:hypothetical protein
MATKYDTITPLQSVKRWSTTLKEKIDVPQPFWFQNYNCCMGGVDLLDQSVNNYRITIGGKKMDVGYIYPCDHWRLYQLSSGKTLDFLQFQREIVRYFLRCYASTKSTYMH